MDLIDREETIKAMDTWDKFGCDENCRLIPLRGIDENSYVPYVHYDDMVKAVKGMPSAEPVTYCKDCEHDGYCRRLSSRTPNDYCSHAKRRTDE